MMNRFANCKTLEDLYSRFNDDTREYSKVSVDELEAIAEVFRAHVEEREMPDTPLTDKGYTYIWNYVVSTVEELNDEEGIEMEEIIMPNNTINETINSTSNKEDNVMKENKVNKAVEEMMNKFQEAKEHTKVNAGETKEEFVRKTDEALNIMKESFGDVLDALDTVLGYSVLKNSVLDMMEASMAGASSKKDLFKMARKCRELIENEIDNLLYWGDEDSFKKAVQLKAIAKYDRDKSIFEAFVSGVIWITKKVFRKLNITSDSDKKGIFASICKGIGTFAKVLRAGVKIVWNAVKFAASFVISGIVITVDWIYHTVKKAVEKLRDWSKEKFHKVKEDTEEDFEDDLENAGDGVFGTNLA